MTTTVVKSIGNSTRDFTSLQAWEDACPSDLVAVDQIWQGELYSDRIFDESLVVSGTTTDTSHYKRLTVAIGHSFIDHPNVATNPLRANQANGVLIANTTAYVAAISVSESNFHLDRIQVKPGSIYAIAVEASAATNVVIDQCIIENVRTQGSLQTNANASIRNSVITGRHSSVRVNGVVTMFQSGEIVNCTLIIPSDITQGTYGMYRNYWSAVTIQNCAFFGFASGPIDNSSGLTASNNYCSTASPPTGFTQIGYDTTTGSGFEGITDANLDVRLKSTSALINAGTSSIQNLYDIRGYARNNDNYDVGAWEFNPVAPTARRPLYLDKSGVARITVAPKAYTGSSTFGSFTWGGFAPGTIISPAFFKQVPIGALTYGTATLDFGSFPGSNEANITLTGLGVSNITRVNVWVSAGDDTSTHTANDHKYFAVLAKVSASASGDSITISGRSSQALTGTFKVRYSYS